MTLLERKKGSTCNCSFKKGSGKAMGRQVIERGMGGGFSLGGVSAKFTEAEFDSSLISLK